MAHRSIVHRCLRRLALLVAASAMVVAAGAQAQGHGGHGPGAGHGERGGERGGDGGAGRVRPPERPGSFRSEGRPPQAVVPVPVPVPVMPPRVVAPPVHMRPPVYMPPPPVHVAPPAYRPPPRPYPYPAPRPYPRPWWGANHGYVVVRPAPIFVAALPAYATVMTIGSANYWYADGMYYRPRPYGGGYEVFDNPPEFQPGVDQMYVYPRNSQSPEQQASDEYECHRWSVDQTGFDPTVAATGGTDRLAEARKNDYKRALAACLDGRGYTVQ